MLEECWHKNLFVHLLQWWFLPLLLFMIVWLHVVDCFCSFVRFLFEIEIHLTKIFPFHFFSPTVHMLCGMFVLAFMVQNSIVGISWGYKSQRSIGWKIGMKQKTEQAQTLIVALVYLWGKEKRDTFHWNCRAFMAF